MDNTEETIKNLLKLSLKKQSHVNNNNNINDPGSTKMLRVKYDFFSQTRVLNLSRPVSFVELYQKIYISLNNQNGLLLHYMSNTKEIFGQISTQSQLEQIVQCVDQNPKYRSLRILVTTTDSVNIKSASSNTSSSILRPDSPPPGCLYPNDHMHMGRSTSFPISHADGEFIPEDDAISTSLSGDSSYSSGRQSILDGNWGSGRRTKLTNIPIYPELPENEHNPGNQKMCTFPFRLNSSHYIKPEGRQTLPRLRTNLDPPDPILSSGRGTSRASSDTNNDYVQRSTLDKTMTRAKTPSMTDYKKGPLLGRGGFGQVYKCLDSQTGREFAMKEVLLNLSVCYNSDVINKDAACLENEINIYRGLMSHQRIVQYFGAKRDQNSMYIFMEFMAGGSIKDQLRQYGPLSHTIIGRYVKQILQGLAFLHQQMIIHRDIKAANILRDIDGNVKLSDFGASRYLKNISIHNRSSRPSSGAVNSGNNNTDGGVNSFCGTFFWMAPEVIRGESYSISADIWSLGATVVEMLTGYPPYHDLEPYAALYKIANTNKVEFNPPVPLSYTMQTFIDKLFVSAPSDRPTTETLLRCDFITNIPSD